MKITNLVVVMLFLLCLMSAGALAPEREKELLNHYYRNGTYSVDVRTLTNDEKVFLIDFIRRQIANDLSERNDIRSMSNETLVTLGDEETTHRFLAHYRETGLDGQTLIDTYNPKIIEVLSADLFHPDPWPIPPDTSRGDQPVIPPSYRVCYIIESLLAGSPQFSPEVNIWATRDFTYDPHRRPVSLLEERTLLRRWWKENEGFFKSKDYKSVKPGGELFGPAGATNAAESSPTSVPQNASSESTPAHSGKSANSFTGPRRASGFVYAALFVIGHRGQLLTLDIKKKENWKTSRRSDKNAR